MDVYMAVQAPWKSLEQRLTMGQTMAFLALRDLAMGLMALCAPDLSMLALGCAPLRVYIVMAAGACPAVIILAERDILWRMSRMAALARFYLLALVVGIVAVTA
jgi:hypothetical protein